MLNVDDPIQFDEMPEAERIALLAWIRATMHGASIKNRRTSHGIKQDFAVSPGGFRLTNGQLKGAMLAAGFEPVNRSDSIWEFLIAPYEGQGRGV